MIRRFAANDIDVIMALWLKSTIEAHYFINQHYWTEAYKRVKEDYLPVSDTFVYDDKGEIKGFISIINKNFIGALFVDMKHQGKGIGKDLLKYSETLFPDLSLAVYKENEKAVKFYKELGFKIIEERPHEETKNIEYYMKK